MSHQHNLSLVRGAGEGSDCDCVSTQGSRFWLERWLLLGTGLTPGEEGSVESGGRMHIEAER